MVGILLKSYMCITLVFWKLLNIFLEKMIKFIILVGGGYRDGFAILLLLYKFRAGHATTLTEQIKWPFFQAKKLFIIALYMATPFM